MLSLPDYSGAVGSEVGMEKEPEATWRVSKSHPEDNENPGGAEEHELLYIL